MSNTFCVLPWYGKEINWNGYNTHCCLLPTHYNVEKIKAEMLRGEKPIECQKCWHLESKGLKSDRQVKNETLDWVADRDLQYIKQDAEDNKAETLMLKLLTSYTCNAMCVSCNEHASSSWYQLKKKMFEIVPEKKYKFVDIDAVKQEINFKNLKMLSLIGGEPLYEKKNFELLEHLLELGNNSVFLSLVTNGSVSLNDRQKTILSKFKNINFSLSIDGTERVFEYLRYPLKWDDLLNNLKFFRDITDNVSSNYTISNLNVAYHNRTVDWFNKEKIIFSNNIIYKPEWLQPKVLPLNVREYLKNTLNTIDYDTFIGSPNEEFCKTMFDKFLIEIKKQDTAKEINLKDYLPELAQMINWT
jgi:organic radical activating enzyme